MAYNFITSVSIYFHVLVMAHKLRPKARHQNHILNHVMFVFQDNLDRNSLSTCLYRNYMTSSGTQVIKV